MPPQTSREFNADSTTEQVSEGIDLGGVNAIVTGASSGLGTETARVLALRGAAVTLACRNVDAGREVAETLRASVPDAQIDVLELDLTRPEQIREFAQNYAEQHDRLNLLINNAGVMACPLMRTELGFEMQFGTNHLGHFLLTGLLVPLLKAGAPSRIVNLSSAGHRFGGVQFEDPNYENRSYDKWEAYGQSKTANVLFSVELNRRLSAAGVEAFAVHPGGIMTALARHLEQSDIEELMSRSPSGKGIKFKPLDAGAATSVWAATAPELAGHGGAYLEDCGIGEPRINEGQEGGVESWATDPEQARRLWSLSEKLLGESFPLD